MLVLPYQVYLQCKLVTVGQYLAEKMYKFKYFYDDLRSVKYARVISRFLFVIKGFMSRIARLQVSVCSSYNL